jgi:peptide/nickel transport system substrate-binding protein
MAKDKDSQDAEVEGTNQKSKVTRRRFLAMTGLTAAGLAVAATVGCGDDDNNASATATPKTSGGGSATAASSPSATAAPTVSDQLVVATPADAFNMGPFISASGRDHHYFYQMYDGLMQYNPDNLVPEPRLLQSAESTSDTEWTFKLKSGVKFHDGTAMTADVVKENLDFVRDASKGSLHAGLVRSIDTVTVVDATTLKLTLKEADAALIDMMCYNPGLMQAKAAIEGDPANNPIGAGPYKFKSRTVGDRTDFVRFTDYWDGPQPFFNNLSIRLIADDTTRVNSLQAGDVDVIVTVPPQSIKTLEASSDFSVYKGTTLEHNKMYIVNTLKAPWDDPRVRRALSMAMDRQEILDKVYFGEGKLGSGTLTPSQWAYDPNFKPVAYDPDGAKALLAAAGQSNMTFTATTYTVGPHLSTAELYQNQLSRIGVTMNITTGESKDWAPALGKGTLDGVVFAPSLGAADPDFQYYAYYYPGGQWNNVRNDNAQAKELILKGRATYDRDQRIAIYRQLDKLLHGADDGDLSLDAVILYPNSSFATSKDIKGFKFWGDGKLRTRVLYKEA